MKARPPVVLLLLLTLTACAGSQSATGGDGAHGAAFTTLFFAFIAVTTFFYVLVIAFLVAAIVRGRRAVRDGLAPARSEGKVRSMLIGWVILTSITLVGLTIGSYFTDRAFAAYGSQPGPVRIQITANQWWWDVQYEGADASERIHTANELHLPAGRLAHIELRSNDVIHSFWVPNLAGKQDLIPGRYADISLLPKHVGLYRAQCAEFCGTQHAHMALDVTVESPQAFAAWSAHQLADAPPPRTPLQKAGYDYVTTRECSTCHTVQGTPANGQVAPDLTHLASRRSIAAGTLPMNRGNLYAWVADPQGPKAGNNMPVIALAPRELDAVVAYLETLK